MKIDIDALSNFIRQIDWNNQLGAVGIFKSRHISARADDDVQ